MMRLRIFAAFIVGSTAADSMPPHHPPPGWQYRPNGCDPYYIRLCDNVATTENPYEVAQMATQHLQQLPPSTGVGVHWEPPCHLLHQADAMLCGPESAANLMWASISADLGWDQNGGANGNRMSGSARGMSTITPSTSGTSII